MPTTGPVLRPRSLDSDYTDLFWTLLLRFTFAPPTILPTYSLYAGLWFRFSLAASPFLPILRAKAQTLRRTDERLRCPAFGLDELYTTFVAAVWRTGGYTYDPFVFLLVTVIYC